MKNYSFDKGQLVITETVVVENRYDIDAMLARRDALQAEIDEINERLGKAQTLQAASVVAEK